MYVLTNQFMHLEAKKQGGAKIRAGTIIVMKMVIQKGMDMRGNCSFKLLTLCHYLTQTIHLKINTKPKFKTQKKW